MVAFSIQQIRGLLLIGLLAFASSTYAAKQLAPDALLKVTTYQLIEALKTSHPKFRNNPQLVQNIVQQYLMPHMDFVAASRWVLGKYWRGSSHEQKIQFIKQFRQLLTRFYSTALAGYLLDHEINHNIITLYPLRANPKDDDVTVHSTVNPPGAKNPLPVNYHMHKTRKGWKIYDVSIEGISMITTYRNNFAAELRNLGVSGVIASLKERNRHLANSTKTLTVSK